MQRADPAAAKKRRMRILTRHAVFRLGMWWRIAYGFLRISVGLVFLKFIGTPFSYLFYKMMERELIEDPGDILANATGAFLQHTSLTVTYFAAAYLIFWGAIDIFLSISLLRMKIWAFPVSSYLIGIFMAYEAYRFFHTHSIILLFIIVIDALLLWIIRREFNEAKRLDRASSPMVS